jgi:hypothetical protein
MTKKNWVLIGIVVVLGVLYVIFFTNMFRSKTILIGDMERSGRIEFGFNRSFSLTYVKVVSVSELESNKYALPVWELKSDSNSVPIRAFAYGHGIPGMKPAVKGTRAEPLDHGTKYRLFVEAGSLKAQHDFTP